MSVRMLVLRLASVSMVLPSRVTAFSRNVTVPSVSVSTRVRVRVLLLVGPSVVVARVTVHVTVRMTVRVT